MDKMKMWMTLILTTLALCAVLNPAPAQNGATPDIVGIWQGKLEVSGITLRIVFHIARKADKTLSATLDSPDQGANGIPIDKASWQDGKLNLGVTSIGGSYTGAINAAGTEIDGSWSQGGASLPLKLTRTNAAPVVRRPQEPQRPFPYDEVEVKVENRAASVTLAGTLTLPRGKGPWPAVFLITGSGPQNRDEELMGHKPFLVLSDYLTRQGIAVLRVDDRGTAHSTGNFAASTTEDFMGDALACVAFLKTRSEIDPKQIGLIGHSEGGLIAPMAAAKSSDVAFIVLMAGPGLPGEQIMYLQGAAITKASGGTPKAIAHERALQEKLFTLVKQEPDQAKLAQALTAVFDAEAAHLPEAPKAALKAQANALMGPWFRYFLTCDPRTYLRQVRCPVLAINGERDLQVPPTDDLPEIEAALKAGNNPDYTVKMLPGLNHLFQQCKTGSPAEYSQIEETIDPSALKVMGDWITAHTHRQ
jgi:pimeloyl-ACP methyl ester carboxylesterase